LQLILKTAMLGPLKLGYEGFGKAFIEYFRLAWTGDGPGAFSDTLRDR
jgi:hypothetical protein